MYDMLQHMEKSSKKDVKILIDLLKRVQKSKTCEINENVLNTFQEIHAKMVELDRNRVWSKTKLNDNPELSDRFKEVFAKMYPTRDVGGRKRPKRRMSTYRTFHKKKTHRRKRTQKYR